MYEGGGSLQSYIAKGTNKRDFCLWVVHEILESWWVCREVVEGARHQHDNHANQKGHILVMWLDPQT